LAVSADIIYEIRSAGSVDNGCGFKVGASGTDYSQQASPQYALTGVTTAAANAILLDAAAAADMVGNIAKIVSGTNFTAGWYEIISVVAGVSITLDRNCTTAAGSLGVVNIGGAGLLDDAFLESWTIGNAAYIKADGTHTPASALTVAKDGSNTKYNRLIGYKTTRGDGDTEANRPTIAAGANIINLDDYWSVENIIFTGTSTYVVQTGTGGRALNVDASNTSGTVGRYGIRVEADGNAFRCSATSTAGGGFWYGSATSAGAHSCLAYDCSLEGFYFANNAHGIMVSHCVADTCGTGFYLANACGILTNLTVYDCTKGFEQVGASQGVGSIFDNIIIDNCTTGISFATSFSLPHTENLWTRVNFTNNTTDKTNVPSVLTETTVAPAFVNAAAGDFVTGSGMQIGYEMPLGASSKAFSLGALPSSSAASGTANLLAGKL
jgi:hypothetical protein